MIRLEFENTTNKDALKCCDFLLASGLNVLMFENDRDYDLLGQVREEANHFWVTVNENEEETTNTLVNEYLNS